MSDSFECPYCGVLAQMDTVVQDTDRIEKISHVIYQCQNCSKSIYRGIKFEVEGNVTNVLGVIHQYPVTKMNISDHVPEKVADLYKEGVRCLNVNSSNGAMTCFRKCLQKICKEKGADESKDLWEQIDSVLQGRVVELSTEIRKWGNIGAHPDGKVPEPTSEQSSQVKEFLEIVFVDEFELPAKIKESKIQREGS